MARRRCLRDFERGVSKENRGFKVCVCVCVCVSVTRSQPDLTLFGDSGAAPETTFSTTIKNPTLLPRHFNPKLIGFAKSLYPVITAGNTATVDNDLEEHLVFCLKEQEQESLTYSEKSQSMRRAQALSSTLAAASRLSAMIHQPGKDQVYANAMLVDQVDDLDIKYRSPVEEEVSSVPQRNSPAWDSFFGSLPGSTAPHRDQAFLLSSSPLAYPFPFSGGGNRGRIQPSVSLSSGLSHRGTSRPEKTCVLSSSLEPVECDSWEEDTLCQSPPSLPNFSSPWQRSDLHTSSGDERDSFDNSSNFNSTHSNNSHTPSKDQSDPQLRLRSYSYSSPKAQLSRPLFTRDAAISDLTEEHRDFNLTETPREKRIEDEEWDKYIIPSKVESEKYKVSRTFSFLKSRMSSPRNKIKVKEGKEKTGKEKTGATNIHQFVPVSPSGPSGLSVYVACDKPVPGKELLQCTNCSLSVHKGCRDSAAACGKRPLEKNVAMLKTKSLPHMMREGSPASLTSSSSLLTMLPRGRKYMTAPLSKSPSESTDRRLRDAMGVSVDSDVWNSCSLNEEGVQVTGTAPSTDHQLTTQESVDTPLLSDLSADLLGFEVESWSLAVTTEFCRKHDKHTVKRQDVIYELMQTELHHIQTLTVMSEVFRRGMLDELQLDWECVARIFPCLDPLLLFHRNLFGSLQERRYASAQPGHPHNYCIHSIGDILLQQFSEDNAVKMKQVYGEFCSHHTEAVKVFKELQQQNKKFQVFVKQQSNNSLVRRREVPEFILLVTQRITKYPVLLERILHYTPEGSEEHTELSQALTQVRDIITAVDMSVSKYEKAQELQEVLSRVENKSLSKLKSGEVFRKDDLLGKHQQRALQHKGLVYWKTATGRLKDTLALLLTDVLVFLQEKDQRLIFAAVDQKPPVIPLQKLIVREVANEERGMFLISASSVGPEMYEVHTSSKEERNAWMRHIRRAVESCPEEEEERSVETEVRRNTELRVQKIYKLQDTLASQDQRICRGLEEKLQLYAELTELTLRTPEPLPQHHLLVQPDPDAQMPPQTTALLTAALKEAEKLMSTLQASEAPTEPSHSPPVRVPEYCSYNSHCRIQELPAELDYLSTLRRSSASLLSDGEWAGPDTILWHSITELRRRDTNGTPMKVAESVLSLTQLLYSLQAAVTIQDSCYEVQKLLLLELEHPLPHTPSCLHGNGAQEQEKQRSAEKKKEEVERMSVERRREEVEGIQKLQGRLRQDQQRWERECLARERQQGEQVSLLEQREQQCHLEAERLRREREELEQQLLEYQQNLERLREGQRSMERDRDMVEAEHRLLQSWRHNRQSSLPIMILLDLDQVSNHSRSGSLDGNEAALLHSLQQNRLHHNQHQSLHSGLRKSQDSPNHSPIHSPNLSLRPSLYNSLNTLLSQAHSKPSTESLTHQHYAHPQHSHLQSGSSPNNPFRSRFTTGHEGPNNNNFSPPRDRLTLGLLGSLGSGVTSLGLYEENFPASASFTPLLTPQACFSLNGKNKEDGGEENIVYL
ncbi:rho guanine nucleotide exchange factor 28-like isoform X2 [Salvelinus fontinalis]|uniref:rho guanine nucleotide exchange factor 28-like isoform X2 n=1 Tax=Salvelinus fontinalis TaxID=8038 RepID=UPI002486C39E|nr:rho guanine nucleotide exchange factor 28-like isoform X2 [Salvelinus fontinalis]